MQRVAPKAANRDIPMRDFRASLPMALLRAREAVMNEFRPNLAAHEINEQQWRVIRALASAESIDSAGNGEVTIGQLAEQTLLLGPSLSRILVRLAEQGLVTRRTDDHDGRRTYVSITDRGIALVRRVAPQSEAIYSGIEERFGRQRLAALLSELDELTKQEQAWHLQSRQNGRQR
jgi:homoprotocatechuate degradation regulator HpaR